MSNLSVLKELGLSDQEATIYLSLLQTGGATASDVAKQVGIKRTTIYAILKNMASKGFLTTYYRKSKQFFYAERPQRVANQFEKQLSTFIGLIPNLESLEKKEMKVMGLRFIETLDELKLFYENVLIDFKNKRYDAIGNLGAWEGLDAEFFQEFRKRRAKAKIRTRILLTADSSEENPSGTTLLREVKILPPQYTFKSTIDIFPDKILIVSPELRSLAIVVAVPAMVDVFREMFRMLWDINKPL